MKKFVVFFSFLSNISFAQVNLDRGLKAYYPFSGNAKDVSGNNNHPVFNNARLTTDRFGNPGSAYHFNGRNNYMQIPNSPSLNSKNKISLCAWVRPMGFYAGKCHGNAVIMKGDADHLTGNYLLRYDDRPFLRENNCYMGMDATHQNFYGMGIGSSSPGSVPYIKANQWYSVIITADGNTLKLYVDCKLIISAPQRNISFTNQYDLYIGRLNHPDFPYWVNGDIDEIRIYDRALNKDEVLAICNEEVPVKKPEFVKKKPARKKNTVIAKQKPSSKDADSVNKIGSLIAPYEPFLADAGFMKIPDLEMEKEILQANRKNELVREIVVDHDSVSITLYDNGEIDGDSITLIYNNKILTTHQLLTDKPLTFIIKIDRNSANELVMYAENLGSIPPNTALMVIYDGDKRYELNVNSTKNSNGAVAFKLRE